MSALSSLFLGFFLNFFTFFSFERTTPFTLKILFVSFTFALTPRLVRNLSIGFSPTQTSHRSKLRPSFAESRMPNQEDVLLRTMPGTELSHSRTELFESFALLPDLVRAVLVFGQGRPNRLYFL